MIIKFSSSLLPIILFFLLTSCSFASHWLDSYSTDSMKEYEENTHEINNDTLKANAMAEALNFKMNCFENKTGEPTECSKFDELAEKCKTNDFLSCKELSKRFSSPGKHNAKLE